MAFSSDVGLVFNITANNSASAAFKEVSKDIDSAVDSVKGKGAAAFEQFAKGLGLSSDRTAELSAALPGLGAGISTIAAAATAGAAGLFNLAKQAADYGSQIHDLAEATNFSTETISALKLAADQSGTSIEAVSGGLGKFTKLLGQSNDGNKQATATLKEYGLTAQTALRDPEAALQKVVARLYELKGSQDQVILTQRTFGKGAQDLIPVINTTNGNLKEYIENGKKLGLVLSQEDADAADQFGDSLGELQQAVRGVSQVFAREFLPDISKAMGSVEQLLLDNKKQFKEWGEYVSDIIRGVSTPDNVNLPKPPDSGGLLGSRPGWFPSDKEVVDFLMNNSSTGNLAKTLSGENAARRGAMLRQMGDRQTQGILEGEFRDPNYGQAPDVAGNKAPGISPDTTRANKEADAAERKAAQAKKKALEAETKTWDARTLAAFAEANGFKPGSGFVKSGHNENSKHYLNQALDVGLGASNTTKTTEDVVALMAKAIESGIRVVDERVKPPGSKVWSAPHVHLEENDKKASYFDPKLDYKGQLEYLKALDKERLAGKGRTVADALDPKAAERQRKEDDEKAIRDREALDNRILELDKTNGEKSKAELENQLAKKQITEQEYADKVADIGIKQLEKEKQLLEERLKMTQLSAEQRAEIQGKIDVLAGEISTKSIEKSTDAIKRQNEQLERQYQLSLEISELRRQVADSEARSIDATKEQEREKLQNAVSDSYGKDRLTALVILKEFEIGEANRKHEREIDDLKDEEDNEIKSLEHRAETDKALYQKLEEEKTLIHNKYKNLRSESDTQNDTTQNGINGQYNPQILKETEKNSGTAGHVADILGGIVGGVSETDAAGKIKSQADYMKGVYDDLSKSSNAAIGSMIGGLGDLVKQWIATGKFSARAAAQMVAGILASLAIEDAVKALHEYAEGLATASNPLTFPLAAGHFAAATAYGISAAQAGAGAAAVGLLSKIGGGGAASQSFAGATSSQSLSGSVAQSSSGANSNEPRVINEPRVQSSTTTHVIEMRVPRGHVERHIIEDINTLGVIRNAIIKIVEENS